MLTLPDLIRWRARVTPDLLALVCEGRQTTYRELDRRTNQVANALIARGVRPGDRVCVLDQNHDMFYELMFGLAKARAVLVPVNWRLAPHEVAYIVDNSEARLLFTGGPFCSVVEKIQPGLETIDRVFSFSGGPADWETFTALRDGASDVDPRLPIDESETVWQLYSSGTTGNPKGVELTTANMVSPNLPIPSWLGMEEGQVTLIVLPLYHTAGAEYSLISIIGGTTLVIQREFNPAAFLKNIEAHKINHTALVPAMLNFVLQAAGSVPADVSSVRTIAYGASPIPAELLRRAIQHFGCQFFQIYGLTETSGGVVVLHRSQHHLEGPLAHRLLSCGQPIFSADVRVVDGNGDDCAPGGLGEVVIQGPMVMKGYWKNPQATAQAIHDGWFHTGDAGYLDADGFLYIQDRIKDVIVSGAEKIYPAEVESCLFAHPAVADVAVIGVPDAQWGEAVKAIVVLRPGASVEPQELIDFCGDKIARFKRPKSVEFATALPRNPSGKILKRELRKPYWEGRQRTVN